MVAALHRGLSKYLTVQDTRGTPTLTKRNRTLASFSFPKTKRINTVGLQFDHSLLMTKSCTQVHSLTQFRHHLLSEINV